MDKKAKPGAHFLLAILTILIVSVAASGTTYGNPSAVVSVVNFKNIPPIVLRTPDGSQYKFDLDILQDAAGRVLIEK